MDIATLFRKTFIVSLLCLSVQAGAQTVYAAEASQSGSDSLRIAASETDSLVAIADTALIEVVEVDSVYMDQLSRNYTDSLQVLKEVLDRRSVEAGNIVGRESSAYYRLFSPLTFFHDVARDKFGLSKNVSQRDRQINDALMAMYLFYPEYVENSQKRLEAAGPIVGKIDQRLKREEDFGKRVAPMPEQPIDVPVDVAVRKPSFWKYSGEGYVQMFQNFISDNWHKGGESNYSMVGSLTLQANYNNKRKIKFDNKLELKLGYQTSRSDTLHKYKTSEDLIRYTGKFGVQATKKWYYTIQLLAYTQFTQGYKANDRKVYSDFMSPFNVNISLGMDYNVEWFSKKLTGTVQIAPLAYNFRYVGRLSLSTRYSLTEGSHTLDDFGSSLTADLTWKFSDNIKWKTRLYGYTTYKRVEIEWENTVTMQFNKYISTNIFLYPRFDDSVKRDDKMGYFQMKEYISLGFNYSF